MNEQMQQLEEIQRYLDTHTGLARYLRMRIENNSLNVESIRAAQVTDSTAEAHSDTYFGHMRPDLILRWFRKNMESYVRREVQLAEIRALCKNSSLIPTHVREQLTGELSNSYGNDWSTDTKAVSYLYVRTLDLCKTAAVCPFCGCHECFDGSLTSLRCIVCKAHWNAQNPVNAFWC